MIPPGEYRLETDLVAALLRALRGSSLWGESAVVTEFDYRYGRTDVLLLSQGNHVVALEAKLERWRDALQQAYRNTFFADLSYVVLPPAAAKRALAARCDFEKRRVGIVVVEQGVARVALEALRNIPLHAGLRAVALDRLSSSGDGDARGICPVSLATA